MSYVFHTPSLATLVMFVGGFVDCVMGFDIKKYLFIVLVFGIGCSANDGMYGVFSKGEMENAYIFKGDSGTFIKIITPNQEFKSLPESRKNEYWVKVMGMYERYHDAKTYELIIPWFGDMYFEKEFRIEGGKTELRKIYVKLIGEGKILIGDVIYEK